MNMRVGSGFDVHAFGPGNGVMLGGVHVPWERGVVAHSDGDVLLHALTDALLGAAGLGDIGRMFPDADERLRGADSRVLLRGALEAVRRAGWRVGNVDATVVAQAPKIAPHVAAMVVNIAADLGIETGCVNIKGKTHERLGFEGRQEGIVAQAVVLLLRASR